VTTVYLAWGSAADQTLSSHVGDEPVDLLVAYPFLADFQRKRHRYNINRWCLDSGAFSAFNSGLTINLDDYIAVCRDVDAVEVFGLDVIGDPVATVSNLEKMWEQDIPAIPTYHYGSPWSALEWCCERSDKIALGGGVVARRHEPQKREWVRQCFARAWPKAIHGFAMGSRGILATAPFESVDASSWIFAPAAMGKWAGFTGVQMPLYLRRDDTRPRDYWLEVVEHQKRARWSAWRWRRELASVRGVTT
jgi:hypothetical protein